MNSARIGVIAAAGLSVLSSTAVAGPTVRAAGEVGITAETLAACGLSATEVQQVLGNVQGATAERAGLASARTSLAAASRGLADIDAQLQSDPLNTTLLEQRTAAAAQLDSARAAFDQAKGALRDAAATGLSSGTVAAFGHCVLQAGLRVPVAMRVVEWTPEQRQAIEAALVAEDRAAANVAPMPQEAAELLAQVRANASVVAAGQAVTNNLAQFQTIFSSWQN
jgi:hypothetical protein